MLSTTVPDESAWPRVWATLSQQVLAKAAPPAAVLLLEGDLGAGKTTFVKTIAAALDSTAEVTSPTFSIVQEYPTPRGPIYHFDLYRLNSLDEVLDLDMEDYLDRGFLVIVEWPAVAMPLLEPLSPTHLRIQHAPDGGREVHIL